MKKIISMIMVLCMLAAMFAINTSAAGITTDAPDWIITEIGCDQTGDGTAGWSDSLDPLEYFELYNNSGKALNLYDYGMFYNGVARTADNFETVVYEYTPFLPGNFFDGWTGAADEWTFTDNAFCGIDNVPKNPDTCIVQPGECVVIWSAFRSTFFADWNNGKGMQREDFRNFYNIPENVQIIMWDGNNATGGAGGHVENFTPKNSAVCTYGVCLKSEVLDADANRGTTTKAEDIFEGSWTENPELISWATVDLTTQVSEGCVANKAFNFVLDNKEIGAKEFYYDFDIRREMLVEKNVDPTPGSLTTLQKMWLGVELDANETLVVGDDTFYAPYSEAGEFAGLKINDKLYKPGETFTASAAGVYTIDYAYGKQAEETTTAAPDTTEAPADTTTAAPETDTTTAAPEAETTTAAPETTTAAPTTNAPTTEAPKSEGGCGGFVALGIVACLIPAAIVVCKKRD